MSRIRLAQSLLVAIAAAWPAVVVAQLPASAMPPTSQTAVRPAGNAPVPITSLQFEQAAQIAKLAAEQGMHALSMRAIRLALASGPPIDLDALPALGKPKPRLSGNWPEKLPPNEELFAWLRPFNEAERAAQAKLVGAEQFESDQTEAKKKTR